MGGLGSGDSFVVDGFGYKVSRRGMRVVVSFHDGEVVERSVLSFSSFVLGGRGSISTDVLRLLASYNIPVVFVDSRSAYGVFHPFFMHGTVLTRREQFLAYFDRRGVVLARGFVLGGLLNKAMVLKYFSRNRDDDVADFLQGVADRIEHIADRVSVVDAESLEDVRFKLLGFEGEGASLYYGALARVFPKKFGFSGRTKRPPGDPVNSLLSYGYVILNGVVGISIAKAGLEPYAGYLHADRSGKPSLILDVSEEFRQPIIDVVVVSLFSHGWVSEEDFEYVDPGVVWVGKGGKKKFFNQFNRRLGAKVRVDGVNTSFEGAIMRQVRKIVRFLLGKSKEYSPFVFRWW